MRISPTDADLVNERVLVYSNTSVSDLRNVEEGNRMDKLRIVRVVSAYGTMGAGGVGTLSCSTLGLWRMRKALVYTWTHEGEVGQTRMLGKETTP